MRRSSSVGCESVAGKNGFDEQNAAGLSEPREFRDYQVPSQEFDSVMSQLDGHQKLWHFNEIRPKLSLVSVPWWQSGLLQYLMAFADIFQTKTKCWHGVVFRSRKEERKRSEAKKPRRSELFVNIAWRTIKILYFDYDGMTKIEWLNNKVFVRRSQSV